MKIQTSRQFLARLASRRFTRALSLGVALVGATSFVCSPSARATVYTYTGGTTGIWSTPTVWNPNGVPTTGDTAVFSGAAAQTVSLGGNQAALDLSFVATAGTSAVRASAAGQVLSLGANGGTATGLGGIQYGSTQTDLGGSGTQTMVISLLGSQFWTGTGTALLQLNSGIATPSTQSITNGSNSAITLTFDGAGTGGKTIFGAIDDGLLGGTTALTMNAGGTLVLVGNNLYSGGTTLSQGGLNLQSNTALGTGPLNITNNANTKTISSGLIGGITLTNSNALNFNGTGAIILGGSQNIDFGFGAVTLGSATILSFSNTGQANTYTFGGDISGAFGLTIQSNQNSPANSLLVLNGTNTANSTAAPLTINGTAPTVKFGNTNAVPTGTGAVVLNGGAIAVGGGTAFTTIASFLTDTRVTKTSGSIALTGDSSESFTAPNASITVGAALGSVVRYTGTITPNGTSAYNVGGGGGTIVFSNNNAFTGTRGLTTNSGINQGAGNTAFGAGGITVITGQNNFDGPVNIGAGTLEVSSINRVTGGTATSNLGAPTTAANGQINIGYSGQAFSELRYTGVGETTDRTLNFNGFSGASIALDASGSGALTLGGAFAAANNSTNRFLSLRGINTGANTITAGIGTQALNAGGINLTKVQRGNWTLTGTNNFAGTNVSGAGIQINGGTLTADYTTNPNVLGATGTNLTLGGGTLAMVYNGATTATQSIGNGATTPLTTLTANSGQSNINVTGNGTAGSAVLTIGSNFTRNGGTFLNFSLLNGGQVASTATLTNGVIVGTGTVAAFTVTDAAGGDFATITGGNIAKLNATTPLPTAGSTNTTNYVLTGGQTQTAASAISTLRIAPTASGNTLALGANNGFTSGLGAVSILKDGANDYTITGTTSLAASPLVLSNFGTGALTVAVPATTGANALTKTGPGLVDLTAANAYTGTTSILGGVLRISNATFGTSNITLNTGGILEIGADLNGAAAGDFTRQIGAGASQVLWGNGDGGFSAAGGNRAVALTNTLGVATGQLTWGSTSGNNAVVIPNTNQGQFNGAASSLFVRDGQALLLSSSTATGTLDFQNPIDLVNAPRAVVVGDGTSAVDAVLSGVLSSSDFSGGLEKSGAGTLAVTAANTYTGETRILGGTLQIGNGGTTGSLSTSSAIINNGTLAFNRTNTLTQGTDFAATVSGTGSVIQLGTGTTILTGNNTYTGGTSINGGTLLVNNVPILGVGSGTGSGAVTVNNGGVLGGTGGMLGAVTVNAGGRITGGTLASIGTLTLQNSLTFTGVIGNFATYAVNIGAGANNSDRLAITGTLNLSGSFDQITFTGTPDGTSNYVLATYGAITGTFDSGTAPAGYGFVYKANELDLVVVPEPGTWAACIAGLGILGVVRYRRRRTV